MTKQHCPCLQSLNTDMTTFECWIIQGGGAGIETKEAVSSDIQEIILWSADHIQYETG